MSFLYQSHTLQHTPSSGLNPNPDGFYGWLVRVRTLATSLDGFHCWQVPVRTLAASPVGFYGWLMQNVIQGVY